MLDGNCLTFEGLFFLCCQRGELANWIEVLGKYCKAFSSARTYVFIRQYESGTDKKDQWAGPVLGGDLPDRVGSGFLRRSDCASLFLLRFD